MSRHNEWILILDYGSQLTQLIARRLRELNIYCEIHPYNVDLAQVITPQPSGIILSGGPMSVNDDGAPQLQPEILEFNLKRLNAMRKCADSISNRKLLNESRFLKGLILDQSIVLETEYYCSSKNLIICFANIFNRKASKTINLITNNYYNIENAIERIRELYKSFKDWTSLNAFYPKLKGTQKFKNEFKIVMVATIAASLELAKEGEIQLRQEKEFGEILLKKSK